MLSREKPYFKVTLWAREESGWTHDIYFQSTGLHLEGAEVRGIKGYEIKDISELSDGEILLLIESLGPCYDNFETVAQYCRLIRTGQNKPWVEFSHWRTNLDDHPEEYKLLKDGQIITWKTTSPYSQEYVVSLLTEQSDGDWYFSEIMQDDSSIFNTHYFLQLRDGRLVIRSGFIIDGKLNISIQKNRQCTSVELAHFFLDPPLVMTEIRAGLLATSHIDGTIKLWDLYHPFQSRPDQSASD